MGITLKAINLPGGLQKHHRQLLEPPIREVFDSHTLTLAATMPTCSANPGRMKTDVEVAIVWQSDNIMWLEFPRSVPRFILDEVAGRTGLPTYHAKI